MAIEKIVLKHLSELNIPVFLEEPTKKPCEYLIIEKLGGRKINYLWQSTVAVQSFSETLSKTVELNEKVMEKMEHLIASDEVTKCSINSNYNFTETQTKRYRYQAIFDIYHY